jgi:hypothetical protein
MKIDIIGTYPHRDFGPLGVNYPNRERIVTHTLKLKLKSQQLTESSKTNFWFIWGYL